MARSIPKNPTGPQGDPLPLLAGIFVSTGSEKLIVPATGPDGTQLAAYAFMVLDPTTGVALNPFTIALNAVQRTGDTMTGALAVRATITADRTTQAADAAIVVDSDAANFAYTRYRKAGVGRFDTGINVSSDYFINRFDNTGTLLSAALTVSNSTGLITFPGNIGIGNPSAATLLNMQKSITGNANSKAININSTIQSDVTNEVIVILSTPSTVAAAFTLPSLVHFYAAQGTIGAGSTVTAQRAFYVASNFSGATNNYAFSSDLASGTNRYNIRFDGTAQSFMAGRLGLGVSTPGEMLDVAGNIKASGTVKCGIYTVATLPSASASGAGARAFVTDSNTVVFNATVASGGANNISVTSDGTNWKIG